MSPQPRPLGSCLGQEITGSLLFSGGCGRACLEAEAVVSCFHNVAAVGKAVEQSGGYFGISKDCGRCCQTNANASMFSQTRSVSGHEEASPLGESGAAVQLEILSAVRRQPFALAINSHTIMKVPSTVTTDPGATIALIPVCVT